MSSIYVTVCESTPFCLVNGRQSEDVVYNLIVKHMDDYRIHLERAGDQYVIEFDAQDVGQSFPERLRNLISSLGPHVTNAFVVQLREDSMMDERDEEVFGGPSKEAITEFRRNYYQRRAMDILQGEAPDLAALMREALAGKLVRPEDVRCVAVMQGGVLQNMVISHPATTMLVTYDDEDQRASEVDIPQSDGTSTKGLVGNINATIDTDWCEQLSAIFEQKEAEQAASMRQTG